MLTGLDGSVLSIQVVCCRFRRQPHEGYFIRFFYIGQELRRDAPVGAGRHLFVPGGIDGRNSAKAAS